jgi:transposase
LTTVVVIPLCGPFQLSTRSCRQLDRPPLRAGKGNRLGDTPTLHREYQDQAVSLVLHSGRTIRDVAKSIGVHEITLGKWVNKAKGDDSGPDKELSETEPAELERLRKENTVLRMKRDFAKKVAAWFAKEQP